MVMAYTAHLVKLRKALVGNALLDKQKKGTVFKHLGAFTLGD